MGLYKKVRKYISGRRLVWPVPFSEGLKLQDIYVRDPYIICDGSGGYILTGTIYRLNYNDSYGVVIYKSPDKKTWSGPYTIVHKEDQKEEFRDFWAPEIHKVGDRWLLAVTLSPSHGKRGTYLFASNRADGVYSLCGRITPADKSSLDGTLYIDAKGDMWCVYCYEYIDCVNGQIRAVRINKDLDGIEEDTDFMLFTAADNKYKRTFSRHKVTDGPFLYNTHNGLNMLWSTQIRGGGYVQLTAHSDDGTLHGRWTQEKPLYVSDGGHGMIFRDYDGSAYLVLHTPNARTVFTRKYEHPIMIKREDMPDRGI